MLVFGFRCSVFGIYCRRRVGKRLFLFLLHRRNYDTGDLFQVRRDVGGQGVDRLDFASDGPGNDLRGSAVKLFLDKNDTNALGTGLAYNALQPPRCRRAAAGFDRFLLRARMPGKNSRARGGRRKPFGLCRVVAACSTAGRARPVRGKRRRIVLFGLVCPQDQLRRAISGYSRPTAAMSWAKARRVGRRCPPHSRNWHGGDGAWRRFFDGPLRAISTTLTLP